MLVIYENAQGMKQVREVPETAMPKDYDMGIVVGPPALDSLDVSQNLQRDINNALVDAGLIEYGDLRGNRDALIRILKQFFTGAEVGRYRNLLLSIYQQHYYPEIFHKE